MGTSITVQVEDMNYPATPHRATANLILPKQQQIMKKTTAASPKLTYPKML